MFEDQLPNISMNQKEIDSLGDQAVQMLRDLIKIPAFSKEESQRTNFISKYLLSKGIPNKIVKNNIIAYSKYFDPNKKGLMLNSHIDTVKPGEGYSFDPFNPPFSETHVFGLGSNDAGGSLVSLLHSFIYLFEKKLRYNLMLVLSCEEEISGPNGIDSLKEEIKTNDLAIIGEPTAMKAAIAERGLLVIDGISTGQSGHAARNEGINALYIAIDDIEFLRNFKFEKISPLLGEVKLTVTQISAGSQHNVVPQVCSFVVDIRPTEQYTNKEILDLLQVGVKSELKARSLLNRSSATPEDSPLIVAANRIGIEQYTSPTTSDWMRISMPGIKMGPGDSARSHRADEYILVEEVKNGVSGYIKFIQTI